MRLANLLVPGVGALTVWACAARDLSPAGQPASNDCAVIAAIAKEHFRFGPENPPPPLKAGTEDGWKPDCDFSGQGFAFTDHVEAPAGSDPRQRLKWVAFGKPAYDANGAKVKTEIMHGPLAGMGYECRLHSGIAGWTVGECKVSWVS